LIWMRSDIRPVPHVVPSNTPITRDEIEIVVFVGPPYNELCTADGRAAGKKSFYRRYFADRYVHVNQDILHSRDRCLKVAEQHILNGKSVVIGKHPIFTET
jgi:bifunctional polynucleotide phosphatase/kinase